MINCYVWYQGKHLKMKKKINNVHVITQISIQRQIIMSVSFQKGSEKPKSYGQSSAKHNIDIGKKYGH